MSTHDITQAELFRSKFMDAWYERGEWFEDWKIGIEPAADVDWHAEGAHPIWLLEKDEPPYLITFEDGSSILVEDSDSGITVLAKPDDIGHHVHRILSGYDLRGDGADA